MEQMQVPGEIKVILDHESQALPYTVKALEPVVFKNGDGYCCLLGRNTEEGIAGYGKTVEDAIDDWNRYLKERIDKNDEDDELTRYVQAKLNASVYKVN